MYILSKVCKGIVIERRDMKSTHEEEGTRMRQMVLAALENQKFSHYRCHRCICTVMFAVPDPQAKHCYH